MQYIFQYVVIDLEETASVSVNICLKQNCIDIKEIVLLLIIPVKAHSTSK